VFAGVVSSDVVSEDLLHEYQLFLDVLRRFPPAPSDIERIRDTALQRLTAPHRLASVSLIRTISYY